MLKTLLGALLASILACAVPVHAGSARPLTIGDVLQMESIGAASLSPDGRWAVFERRAAYDVVPRYDLGQRSIWAASRLWIADTTSAAAPQSLLAGAGGTGVTLGEWSPTGERLLVFRLQGRRWEAGIVRVSDRTVLWTGLTPDLPLTGAAFAWRDDRRLILTIRPDGSLPWPMAYDGESQIETQALWRAAAAGQSSKIAFAAKAGVVSGREEPDLRVVEIDAETGDTRTLARGAVQDFALSPDQRTLAVLTGGDLIALEPAQVVQMGMARRSRLSLVDLENLMVTAPEETIDVAPHLLRWSADSARVLIWARLDGDDWRAGDLAAVTRRGRVHHFSRGTLDPLGAGATIDQLRGVGGDWLDDVPLLYARSEDGDRYDWYALTGGGPRLLTGAMSLPPRRLSAAPAGRLLLIGDGRLWRIARVGAAERVEDYSGLVDPVVNDLQKPVRLRVNTPPREASMFAQVSDQLRRFTPQGLETIGPVSENGRVVALGGSSALTLTATAGVVGLDLVRDGVSRRLVTLNASYTDRSLAQPLPIDHRDRRGRSVRSWMFPPADRPLSEARGLIVIPYPGSLDSGRIQDPFTLAYNVRAALLASEGFAVLSPNLPFAERDGLSIEQIDRGVTLALDATLAAYPDLSAERIGLFGHSHGGYLVLGMAARSTRYRAVVAWAGMSDLAGEWGEFTPISRTAPAAMASLRQQSGWIETAQGQIIAPPYKTPQVYTDASPYFEADRIAAPVLLITADRDFVPASQSERMFSAIAREGGQARLVTYWGEGHFNWSPDNIRDLYQEIVAWFDAAFTGPAGQTSVGPSPPSQR